MKLYAVIKKSLTEQLRNFWILLLTISMAPFFVFLYYLFIEASNPHYDILLLNQDAGIEEALGTAAFGPYLTTYLETIESDTLSIPLSIEAVDDQSEALARLKNGEADALVIIPPGFSRHIYHFATGADTTSAHLEFIGDLTNVEYMITAIWANELITEYAFASTGQRRPIQIQETALGTSGDIDEFDYYMPGILILSIIMLMFSATIAMITEVEHKTIFRITLSRVSTLTFLTGVSLVQIGVGVVAVLLTLLVAVGAGFAYAGSFLLFLFIAVLTSISMIAFSLILAAFTKTTNEVLIVGNFPLFLFMFFTGAAFPLEGKTLFTVAGYPLTLQGLMSPTHAISALKKILIMDMGAADILPEVIALMLITLLYFIIGVWAFGRRHMRLI